MRERKGEEKRKEENGFGDRIKRGSEIGGFLPKWQAIASLMNHEVHCYCLPIPKIRLRSTETDVLKHHFWHPKIISGFEE
jgi:hypothetical protein